jgi:hypothetical protein
VLSYLFRSEETMWSMGPCGPFVAGTSAANPYQGGAGEKGASCKLDIVCRNGVVPVVLFAKSTAVISVTTASWEREHVLHPRPG